MSVQTMSQRGHVLGECWCGTVIARKYAVPGGTVYVLRHSNGVTDGEYVPDDLPECAHLDTLP